MEEVGGECNNHGPGSTTNLPGDIVSLVEVLDASVDRLEEDNSPSHYTYAVELLSIPNIINLKKN